MHASSTPGVAGAAADENRVGRRQARASAAGAAPCDDLEARHAERARRCGGCAPRARALRLDRDGAHATDRPASIRSRPSPRPAPTSHSISPRRGASADSVTARISRLVIWPSCSNSSSARPGARAMTRAPCAADHLDRDGVERDRRRRDRIRAAVVARMRSRGPPSASSTVKRDRAEAASRRASAASAAGVVAVRGQRQHARAGLQMRDDAIERAAVQRDERAVLRAPSRAAPPRG